MYYHQLTFLSGALLAAALGVVGLPPSGGATGGSSSSCESCDCSVASEETGREWVLGAGSLCSRVSRARGDPCRCCRT